MPRGQQCWALLKKSADSPGGESAGVITAVGSNGGGETAGGGAIVTTPVADRVADRHTLTLLYREQGGAGWNRNAS